LPSEQKLEIEERGNRRCSTYGTETRLFKFDVRRIAYVVHMVLRLVSLWSGIGLISERHIKNNIYQIIKSPI
jgi:hypothetical protein